MNSAADQPTVERSIHTSPMQQLRWHRAACSDTHRTGFGLIIRDVQGDLLFAACYKPLSKFNPTLAEASCFRWAFETDCSMLTKIWHSPGISLSYLHSILEDCKMIISNVGTYSFVHVKRQSNMVTDLMAKYAFVFPDNVWVEEGPVGLGSILLEDQSSLSIPNQ